MIGRLALIGILSAAAVVGNAQQFNWLRDANGRNMEFVQQGGAASKYSYYFQNSYGKTWVDGSSWTLQSGGLLEAVIGIRPGTEAPPPPSQRTYYIHTATSEVDAKWNNLSQQILLGSVLSEQLLPWQTVEGYDEYLIRWAVPELIGNKWLTVVEDQPNGVQLGRSRLVQGTSTLFASDIFTTSTAQGSSESFPNVNLALANPVPEPATVTALGIGVVALLRRRRNHSAAQSGAAGAAR